MDPDLLVATYFVKATAVATAAALIWRARPRPAPLALVPLASAVLLAGVLWRMFPALGFDYRIFWETGGDVWAERDPYAASRGLVSPPTALPLFAFFALAPFPLSFLVWTVLNVLACLLLLPLSQSVLVAQGQADAGRGQGGAPLGLLPPLVLLGLTPALVLSDAALVSFYLGQLGIFESVALLAALRCQARGRPAWAGVWLALATVKALTLVPFLLLFHRRADRRTWAVLPAAALALCLLTGGLADLPSQGRTILGRVREMASPGAVNDYTFEGPRSENMLGFDHAFYRLGIRDRGVVTVCQYLALAALGAWVAGQVMGKHRLPRPAACSLVALYSVVFLYHRNYDTLILALPFAYSAGQARSSGGSRRYLFAGCALAIILIWYLDIVLLGDLQRRSQDWGAGGWLVQACVLPYATWLVVLAMIALAVAARRPVILPGHERFQQRPLQRVMSPSY
jgi:hypothetical protein